MATVDNLDAYLVGFDADRAYTTCELLKSGQREQTERVVDAAGNTFIRKYITLAPHEEHPYSRIAQLGCLRLPEIESVTEFEDTIVVVMEDIHGNDLRTCLSEGGPLSVHNAQKLFEGLADAVRALHNAPGMPIIHRDINPGNIIIDASGARLIDFGIARSMRDQASRDTTVWGTAGYAAPEQFGFRQTDKRTDVYALGMVLRFMLTGADPDEPAEIPNGQMAAIVAKATELDPADRYASVDLMAADVAAGKHGVADVVASDVGRVRHAAWRVWQAFVIFVCVVLMASVIAMTVEGGNLNLIIGYWDIVLFFLCLPLFASTSFFDQARRVAFLRENRRLKLLLISLVSIVIAVVAIAALKI